MALLDRGIESGAVAPQLWPVEALNVLLMAERRGRIGCAARQSLAGFLQALPISIDEEMASRAWSTTANLAEQQRLTAYDAAYLELALRRGKPLATRDTALIAAAKNVGVPVLPTD